MELRAHTPYAALSWLMICFALLILVPTASTQSSFAFLQPLPTPVQCQTYAFAWTSGGTPPYNLIVSVSGNWGKAYGINGLEGQGVPWMIPVPAGYAVSFELFDNASHVATAGPLTIQSSDNTSCLGSGAPTSSSPQSAITSPPPTTSSPTETPKLSSPTPLTNPTTSSSPTSEAPSSQPPSSSSSSSTSSSSSLSSTTLSSTILQSTLSTSSSSTSQALPNTDGVLSTILVTASPAAATNTSTPIPTPHHAALSTGAIAGVAVGGAAVLVLAGFSIWFCRRRDPRPRSGAEWNTVYSDTPTDLHPSGQQMSETVAPGHRPRLLPATPSSSRSSSDPSASDWYGSHQLLLHPGSEGSVSGPSHHQLDGAAQPRSTASLLPSSQSPRDGAQSDRLAVHDEMEKPPEVDGLAMATPQTFTPDDKLDSPAHPSRGTVQGSVAVSTDVRYSARARSMRFEEDGGVRLAGGLPGEVLDEGQDVDDSRRWVVQPPPYQRFR